MSNCSHAVFFSPEEIEGRSLQQPTASSWVEWRGRFWSLLSGDSDRIWGDSMKLHHRRIRLRIRKRLFTEVVSVHWNRLSRKLLMAWSLLEFKKHLDDASWTYRIGRSVVGPFQLGIYYDFINYFNRVCIILCKHKEDLNWTV